MYEREDYGYSPLHLNRLPRPNLTGNMVISPEFANPMIPSNPNVKLKKLAFYDILDVLIKPSTLSNINNNARQQEKNFSFVLTPQQATELAMNRDISNPQKVEHLVQVQLRFCQFDTTAEQEDCFPPNVIVKVNNKPVQLPNPIPTNKPGVEAKRPPRPVNITPNVKLSPTVQNQLHVTWCMEFNRSFVISLNLVKKLTSSELLHRLKCKGLKPAERTRSLIKEKLSEDDEIATTMLKVSLVCPLGKMRMTTPCRAYTCSHLQCFDASLYLQMNERKPTWNCPVCDKPALFDNLVIDGYFQEVLASGTLPPDKNEIQLHQDGSWSCHIEEKKKAVDTPKSKVEVVSDDIEIITMDDDDDDFPQPPKVQDIKPTLTHTNLQSSMASPAASTGSVSSTPSAPSSNIQQSTTVDLTLSDSDEEPPPSNKTPIRSQPSTPAVVNPRVSSNGAACSRPTSGGKPNEVHHSSMILLDSPSPPQPPFLNPAMNGYGSVDLQAQMNALYPRDQVLDQEALRLMQASVWNSAASLGNQEELARLQYLEQLAAYDYYQQYLDRRDT